MANATAKYVKFQRGTPTAYAAIKHKDPDTLYFISNPNDTFGNLYLGEKSIGNGSPTSGAFNLAELGDVDLTGASDGAVLVYSEEKKKWIVSNITDIENIINSVSDEFIIVDDEQHDKQLQINDIHIDKIDNLQSILDNYKQTQEIQQTEIGKLNDTKLNKTDFQDIENRVLILENSNKLIKEDISFLKSSIDLGEKDGTPILVKDKIGDLSELIQKNTDKIAELDARLIWNEMPN